MSDPRLEAIRAIIQEDVGNRGLRGDPADNLITRTVGDLEAACRGIAETPNAAIAVVTGFFIPQGQPPAGETDGPLGALFLARALTPLGIRVVLAVDSFGRLALEEGLAHCGLDEQVMVVPLPPADASAPALDYADWFDDCVGPLTHLLALERVGPSHADGLCRSMRGRDVTPYTSPAHLLFEEAAPMTTIGIGDGGNEIGMGKLPREVIARNIPNGEAIACRVPCEQLIVAGVSNWGAYGLAAGVRLLRGARPDPELFDAERERQLLQRMVEQGPLVDGVTGKQEATVDGLSFEKYGAVLRRLGEIR